MSSNRFTYRRGAELPGLTLPWQEETSQNVWTDLDLSSGWTFTLALVDAAGTSTAMSGTVTGANGSVSIAWAVDDLDLTPGVYELALRATETATSKDRDHSPDDRVRIVIV